MTAFGRCLKESATMPIMGSMDIMEEHEITLTMTGTSILPREVLEEMTFRAQDALVAKARDFALGAAAAANFAENSIEVDFVVMVSSSAEVYERVAAVVRVLEEAGFSSGSTPKLPPPPDRFALSSSATQAVSQTLCVA
jgi:hypothetical protein